MHLASSLNFLAVGTLLCVACSDPASPSESASNDASADGVDGETAEDAGQNDGETNSQTAGGGGNDGSPMANGDATGATCEVALSMDDDLTIGDFTQEQANEMCTEYNTQLLCIISEADWCIVEGLFAARQEGTDSQETCRREEQRCLAEGSQASEDLGAPCDDGEILSECEVTVAEAEQCLRDQFAYAAKFHAERPAYSCDDVGGYFERAAEVEIPEFPSCAGVRACEEMQ